MAARPLLRLASATMISTCHTSELVTPSQNSSRQCSRGTTNECRSTTMDRAITGSPSQMHSVRNASGGKSVTPSFITGQLKPHTSVSKTSRMSWRRLSCMGKVGRESFGC